MGRTGIAIITLLALGCNNTDEPIEPIEPPETPQTLDQDIRSFIASTRSTTYQPADAGFGLIHGTMTAAVDATGDYATFTARPRLVSDLDLDAALASGQLDGYPVADLVVVRSDDAAVFAGDTRLGAGGLIIHRAALGEVEPGMALIAESRSGSARVSAAVLVDSVVSVADLRGVEAPAAAVPFVPPGPVFAEVVEDGAVFLRGDANVDGVVDISDGYVVLNALILGSQTIRCEDSADSNDDGVIDLSDSINTFHFLFLGTGRIPEPYPSEGVNPTPDALGCASAAPQTPIDPLVAVREPEALAGFTFERVIQQLIDTSRETAATTPLDFYQQWWAAVGSECQSEINGHPNLCDRADASLEDNDPFSSDGSDSYAPVAVFNRFDLAPADGSNCGEARVVFAKRSGIIDGFDRNLVIFESALPNPSLAAGLAGCAPIQRHWQAIADAGTTAERATLLEQLFFDGLEAAGVAPAIHAEHISEGGPGQVRSNTRMSPAEPWALREFELRTVCGGSVCVAYLFQAPVTNTVPAELFAGGNSGFNAAFTASLDGLAQPSPRFEIDRGFWDAISVIDDSDDYTRLLDPELASTEVANRALGQSCAGCHELAGGRDIGQGQTQPISLGNVHVSESGGFSAGLVETFLPERAALVRAYLDSL